jgi:hypothetical protein
MLEGQWEEEIQKTCLGFKVSSSCDSRTLDIQFPVKSSLDDECFMIVVWSLPEVPIQLSNQTMNDQNSSMFMTTCAHRFVH